MNRLQRQAERVAERRARGAAGRIAGRRAEVLAAIWLMLKGYRILGSRLRTPQGESTSWASAARCWPWWR